MKNKINYVVIIGIVIVVSIGVSVATMNLTGDAIWSASNFNNCKVYSKAYTAKYAGSTPITTANNICLAYNKKCVVGFHFLRDIFGVTGSDNGDIVSCNAGFETIGLVANNGKVTEHLSALCC